MRRCPMLAFVVAGFLVAPSLCAQTTTGVIRGVVSDDSGGVLPGVTVTLKGPATAGTPTTTTNETGVYRFPNLAPGAYQITVELTGFNTSTQTGIQVALGGTTEVGVQLKLSNQQETVTVVAQSPVVDATTTQVATNYSREWVANAPVRRFTFFDLINAAPGVSASTSTSSRSQSFGSATNENVYLIDGTDFTAPLTGAAWPWPNTDAIEEIQVLSLGAPADYGNLGGAVFNVVTRQGGNTFHGDANFYFQTQSLTGRNTTDAQDNKLPYHRDEFKDTTVQLGGPVMKDKLWFFGSYQYQKDADSQPGTDAAFPARSSAKRYFWKVNYQLNQANRFQVQMHDDFYRIPGRATANTAPSTLGVENGHNPSPGVLWTSVINSTTVLEARYSGFYGVDHGDPLNGGPRVARRFNDLDTGQITGGIYSWYDGKSAKTAFSGKVTKYADKFLGGSHDFKLGVQYNSGLGEYTFGRNDYIYTYGAIPAYGYTQLPFTQGGRLKSIGVFADDAYQIGRATINLGIRYDNSKAYFLAQDLLDASGNPTGVQSKAVDDLFNWRVVSQGALWALLPRHHHRGVRQHHAVDHAEIRILGTLQRVRSPAGQGPGLGQLQTVGRPELEEPVHRSVHRGVRAAGRAKRRRRGQLRLQTQRAANGVPRHRRHLSAGPLRRSVRCDRAPGVPIDEWRRFTAVPAQKRRPHVRALPRRRVRHQKAHVEPLAGQLRADAVEVHRASGWRLGAFHSTLVAAQHGGHLRPEPERFHQQRRPPRWRPAGGLEDAVHLPVGLGNHVVLQFPESERQADLLGDSRHHRHHRHSWSDQDHCRA
jgi:hypothetical protein